MTALQGRVAVVTGAAEGPKASLGAAFARCLADAGAIVVACDKRDCGPVAAEIAGKGGQARAMTVDVSQEDSVRDMFAELATAFGRVDILVNNAAVGSNIPPVALRDLDVASWDEVMGVNVRGSFLCAKHVAPIMAVRNYGKIVNIGSTTSREGLPQRLHYVVAKGAIETMTRALARELGPSGIRINCLAPGLVMSRAIEQALSARPGLHEAVLSARSIHSDIEAADLLKTLIYLCSPDSDPVTGQFVAVDNGATFV
jgi:NAD(P)-dependent dehydrogenase (short-subunit alcohol dehydrogenase family)